MGESSGQAGLWRRTAPEQEVVSGSDLCHTQFSLLTVAVSKRKVLIYQLSFPASHFSSSSSLFGKTNGKKKKKDKKRKKKRLLENSCKSDFFSSNYVYCK